ncbi:uncharacterized protein AMSG_09241 [Thecamonas trahens ATCC 50062]|uniref:Uncharacterized protein n=1 Tax=Thecamonas trahens ATCC 50062 TaxID=461836 RepID=A0A0L0DLI2_THETB|nr:hypothetical protein AMSG_09241 [Thecamonas trahens ATCC 50062]KNC53162.1 hypothetical protein AMSG_09241 [Thecamonas trahens ATCC 50062]|eukprot:XP_013754635.1 hypothetical protein AMSG_09241 [Thecamonas trahens ATCC 50062]
MARPEDPPRSVSDTLSCADGVSVPVTALAELTPVPAAAVAEQSVAKSSSDAGAWWATAVLPRSTILEARSHILHRLAVAGVVDAAAGGPLTGSLAAGADEAAAAAIMADTAETLPVANVVFARALWQLAADALGVGIDDVVALPEREYDIGAVPRWSFEGGCAAPGEPQAPADGGIRMWIPLGNVAPHQGAVLVAAEPDNCGAGWLSASFDMGDVVVLSSAAKATRAANTTGRACLSLVLCFATRVSLGDAPLMVIDADVAASLLDDAIAAARAAAAADLSSDDDLPVRPGDFSSSDDDTPLIAPGSAMSGARRLFE